MIVYLVSSGDYSDFTIEALFSTRELAEEYVAKIDQTSPYRDPSIEEHELDILTGAQVRTSWTCDSFHPGRAKEEKILHFPNQDEQPWDTVSHIVDYYGWPNIRDVQVRSRISAEHAERIFKKEHLLVGTRVPKPGKKVVLK